MAYLLDLLKRVDVLFLFVVTIMYQLLMARWVYKEAPAYVFRSLMQSSTMFGVQIILLILSGLYLCNRSPNFSTTLLYLSTSTMFVILEGMDQVADFAWRTKEYSALDEYIDTRSFTQVIIFLCGVVLFITTILHINVRPRVS